MKHTLRSIGAAIAVLAGAALIATSAAGAASAGNPWHGVSDGFHNSGLSAGHPWDVGSDGFHGTGLSAGHPWHG
ncbi:hypothetical protein [Kribbella italica]|uniref:Uncharacterized protein n=1 Tax=Kribbella italica TaxID=1540520 RepID=A0A7W9J9B5_9ACTN|nr:hypothetical protein [Kribbella italica]MBB5837770.1 hypothetical protein [Kribbella italica]